jgi:hypothetical protein
MTLRIFKRLFNLFKALIRQKQHYQSNGNIITGVNGFLGRTIANDSLNDHKLLLSIEVLESISFFGK